MGTVIVVTSGKGGTGKTTLVGGLAVGLAKPDRRVLCIDCDIGLRNLDISLAMSDMVLMDFSDVMLNRCSLSRAAAPHPTVPGLFLLTAPLTPPSETLETQTFRALLEEARAQYDYILLDSPAGLGLGFSLATCDADRAIVVATNDAASLRDAQRVVGQLAATMENIHLVVNRVSPKLLRRLHSNIDEVMDFVGLPLLGLVPEDPQVVLSASAGRPLLQNSNSTKGAAAACGNIARRITGQTVPLLKIR